MSTLSRRFTDVLIIGAGPAGLSAAAALAPRRPGQVLVLDREKEAGGIPRHSDHLGYGMRDLHRFMSGPAYARRLTQQALRAGAEIQTEAMVTDWAGDRTVEVTSPHGRTSIEAQVIILATGARERPRPARLVPGDRPAGVYTTGQLQNLVHLHHRAPGTLAVIVGAELVSWSAAMTLRESGCETALMTSVHSRPEAYAAFTVPGRLALGIPVATRTRVTQISGRGRVSAVEVEDLDTQRRRTVRCDTVVFTGDWIPDHELARSAGLEMNPGTRGPAVDTRQATSRPGLFAIGNLTHPVDTADVAALDGRAVAEHALNYLAGERHHTAGAGPRIEAGSGLKWITPSVLVPGVQPARGRLLAWPHRLTLMPTVTVRQDATTLGRRRLPWPASPGRVFRIPTAIVPTVNARGGTIIIDVE
ncbi:MAG: FAD-dependent oxidoreductase [Solirubrobacteraceae bacterium]